MPYIDSERRKAIWSESLTDYNHNIETAGELNYYITDTIIDYMKHKGLSYQTINDILGALSGATLEFNRRVVVPFENAKIAQNGDLYSE